MPTLMSKRNKENAKLLEKGKIYQLKDAVQVLKSAAKTKFDQSVEIQCKLGVDPAASDQVVRGTAVLPMVRAKN